MRNSLGILSALFCVFLVSATAHALETPHFAACKDRLLLSTEEYERLRNQHGDLSHCEELQWVAPAGESLSGMQQIAQHTTFLAELEKEVRANLALNSFAARRLQACAARDEEWFRSVKLDPKEQLEGFCRKALMDLRGRIAEAFPEMRLHLALKEPKFRDDRELPDMPVAFKITTNIKHEFPGFAKLQGLSEDETKEALRRWDEDTAAIQNEIRARISAQREKDPRKLDPSAERLREEFTNSQISKGIRSWRNQKHVYYREQYLQAIQELPVLAFLTSGEPSDQELAQAFARVHQNAEAGLKKKAEDLTEYLAYAPAIERVLERNSQFCGVAQAATDKFRSDRLKRDLAIGGGLLALNVGCALLSGPVAAACFLALGAPVNGAFLAEAAFAYRDSLRDTTSSVEGELRLKNIADLDEKARSLYLAAAMAPVGTGVGRIAKPALRKATEKLAERSLARNTARSGLRSDFVSPELALQRAQSAVARAEAKAAEYAKRGIVLTAKQEEDLFLKELGGLRILDTNFGTGLKKRYADLIVDDHHGAFDSKRNTAQQILDQIEALRKTIDQMPGMNDKARLGLMDRIKRRLSQREAEVLRGRFQLQAKDYTSDNLGDTVLAVETRDHVDLLLKNAQLRKTVDRAANIEDFEYFSPDFYKQAERMLKGDLGPEAQAAAEIALNNTRIYSEALKGKGILEHDRIAFVLPDGKVFNVVKPEEQKAFVDAVRTRVKRTVFDPENPIVGAAERAAALAERRANAAKQLEQIRRLGDYYRESARAVETRAKEFLAREGKSAEFLKHVHSYEEDEILKRAAKDGIADPAAFEKWGAAASSHDKTIQQGTSLLPTGRHKIVIAVPVGKTGPDLRLLKTEIMAAEKAKVEAIAKGMGADLARKESREAIKAGSDAKLKDLALAWEAAESGAALTNRGGELLFNFGQGLYLSNDDLLRVEAEFFRRNPIR